MQQLIDLFIFLVSNAVLIYWCVLVFKNKESNTFFLRLTKKQLVTLIIVEVGLFSVMYLNYETHKSVEVADSFAWHYSIVYARGVLPLAGLSSINDKAFNFKDPVFSCLAVGLIVDYIILFLCSKIARLVKK